MSGTRLIDCDNKDNYDLLSIVQGLLYYDYTDLDSEGKPKLKIRTQ